MCAAAAAFLEIGTVRHLAPDPWALASGQPDNARWVQKLECHAATW
jgi:hypothetical protein